MDRLYIILNIPGIQRQFPGTFLYKIYVLLTISNLIILLIYSFIIFTACKLNFCNRIKFRDLIMLYHIAQFNIKGVQRIILHKIHISIPDRNIPFFIHLTVIAQQDLIGFLFQTDMDRTERIAKPILA